MATKKREILIVGNWKMNPGTIGQAKRLFHDVQDRLGTRPSSVRVVIAPPSPFISELAQLSPSSRIALGAQDVFFERTGAYTGEVSLSMLKSVGVRYVIVGHSERRARGENNEEIGLDLKSVLKSKVNAILCVGETERDKQGNYFTAVEAQLRAALADVDKKELSNLSIAYEPVWAIGTGDTATPEDAYEMKLFIQKLLVDRFGRTAAEKIRILYGGSVNRTNAETLLTDGKVDGFLVGGASLKATDFGFIIDTARTYGRTHAS